MNVHGAHGRDRAIAMLRAARTGTPCRPLHEARVELLVRYPGRWLAVERNRVRRRLREIFREFVSERRLISGVAVALKARRGWLTCPWSELKEQVWAFMAKEMRLIQ